MAMRKMKMARARTHKPTPKATYKQRVAKPEPDMTPKRPKKRSNYPKGFI